MNIIKNSINKDRFPKIGVIGTSSMIGSRFCELTQTDFEIIKADLSTNIKVDVTNAKSVDNFVKNNKFSNVILFSAFTDVDAAEKQRGDKNGLCWQVNVHGVQNVANACSKYKRGLIFLSTSFVFDGTNGLYDEDAPTGPNLKKVSWYGITKIEAENFVKSTLTNYIIIRIAYPYRAKFGPKDDFAKLILRKYRQGSLYPMFSDQTITPTFIDDLAPAIKLLISKGQSKVFNLSSPEPTTPYEFAKYLIEVFGGDASKLKEGSIVEFLKKPMATPRAVKGALSTKKIEKLGFYPTNWREGIKTIYTQSNGKLI